MAGKAKFRVGQVVAFIKEHPLRHIWFGKVRYWNGNGLYNVDGAVAREEELRSLTKRERGSDGK